MCIDSAYDYFMKKLHMNVYVIKHRCLMPNENNRKKYQQVYPCRT